MNRITAFLLGLALAAAITLLWVLSTGGTRESLNITITPSDSATVKGSGLIGRTEAGIAERLTIERTIVRPVRGPLTFRVADITWEDRGHPAFVRAAEMRGTIDKRAASNDDIVIHGLSIRNADVYVEENGRLEWNYQRVMAPFFEPRDPDAPERAFIVTDIALQNTRVNVKMPNRAFAFEDVSAHLTRADFAGPRLAAPRVMVARATGTLVTSDSAYRMTADNALLVFPTGRVDFTVAQIATGESRVTNMVGTWGGGMPGYALNATGRVDHLNFHDVRFLGKRVPRVGTASFGFHVRPVSDELTEFTLTNAIMESRGSRITGSATVQAGIGKLAVEAIEARFDPLALSLVEQMIGDTLPFRGSVIGTARGTGGLITFDVATRLTTAEVRTPFLTRLVGTALLGASGFEIRRLEATLRETPLAALRTLMPGIPLQGFLSGKFTLSGPPGKSPLTLNVRAEVASGVMIADGKVDMSGPVPSYELSGRLLAVNVQQLLKPAAPPVLLTAHFDVTGAGTDPNTARARVHVEGRFTGWKTSPHDTLHLAARLAGGTLTVDSAAVKLATMNASARGDWHFAEPASGSINYRVAFEPITPFGPYIPAIGNEDAIGNIAVSGIINGARGQMRVEGEAQGSGLQVGQWAASSLDSKYLAVIGAAFPQISVSTNVRDFRTPTAGSYQRATVNVKLESPIFALNVKADRVSGKGGIEIIADGRIPVAGTREIMVHTARIDFGDDNWKLATPAVFSWAAPGTDLTVRGFEMRESGGAGLMRLEGRVLPLANADFRLETVALPIGDIQRLLGRPPIVSGALSTTTTIRATNGVPQLSIKFVLDSAVVENVRFSQLTGDASYSAQKLVANATAIVDTAGALRLRADVPIDWRFGEGGGLKMLEAGPVNITLVSDSIALAPFAALNPDIEELRGTMSANVTVTGTVQAPVLAGMLSIRDASAHLIPLNQRFDSVFGTVVLENRRAVIQQLTARAGGRVRATGSVEFKDLTKPVLDITANFDRFQAMGVDNQADAQTSGQVHLAGPLRAAVLTGDLRVRDGYFPIPLVGSTALDKELARFEPDVVDAPIDKPPPTPFYNGLVIDGLRVAVGPNLWFSMPDAKAELAGALTIDKHGLDARLTGELEGDRGSYVLRAGPIVRRFDVVHANVRFIGTADLNPAIDITARRTVIDVAGRQLDIDVRVGGTLQLPTLALASQDAAAIPQSELISFLLFGQPSLALGVGNVLPGERAIEQTVGGTLTELAGIGLEQALLDQLGMSFDVFQIRFGGGSLTDPFSGSSLVIGREIATNVFLTVESGVGALFSGSASTPVSVAVRLEWRVNRNTTVRASYEPTGKGVLRGYTFALQPTDKRNILYQGSLEIRRRWTW